MLRLSVEHLSHCETYQRPAILANRGLCRCCRFVLPILPRQRRWVGVERPPPSQPRLIHRTKCRCGCGYRGHGMPWHGIHFYGLASSWAGQHCSIAAPASSELRTAQTKVHRCVGHFVSWWMAMRCGLHTDGVLSCCEWTCAVSCVGP